MHNDGMWRLLAGLVLPLCAVGIGSAAGPAAGQASPGAPGAFEIAATDLGPVFRAARGRIHGQAGEVLGVDGAYSVPVASGRSLWIFGDTVLGTWTADGSRSMSAMPANSAAIVRDADWTSGFKGARWVKPAPVLSASSDKRRRWPLDAVRVGGRTWLYWVEIEPTGGTGLFDFAVVASGVARLGSHFGAVAIRPLWDGWTPTYGTSALPWKGTLYAYAGGPASYLARVMPGRLREAGAYSYWAGEGKWAGDPGKAAPLPESGPEMSVRWNPYLGAFLMVYIPPLGREIKLRTAPEPWGPWSEPRSVAPCQPEGDPDASCYGAKQHVELDRAGGREVFLTYNTNVVPARLMGRPDMYWPRLVRVRLTKPRVD